MNSSATRPTVPGGTEHPGPGGTGGGTLPGESVAPHRAGRRRGSLVRLGFWVAVVLPATYLPLLFVPPALDPGLALPLALGGTVPFSLTAFCALVTLHLLARSVGHGYAR